LIRIGILGFDTSHAVHFTRRINHIGVPSDQWVKGARVVAGYPGEHSSFVSDEVLEERTKEIREAGVEIVDSPEALIGSVDAVMLEFQDGSQHLQQAKPFIEARIPIFIDKPFACSLRDAKEIARLAEENGVPVFSSSSLRYALEVQNLKSRRDIGGILGVDAYSPGPTHPKNPGLFNYGIHAVEVLYALMGPGCRSVRCIHDERWDKVIGVWNDGRIGTVRAMRMGVHGYGFTAFYEKGIFPCSIDTRYIYRELLKRVIEMFNTKVPPINIWETIEIVAFIEAALRSAEKNGSELTIQL